MTTSMRFRRRVSIREKRTINLLPVAHGFHEFWITIQDTRQPQEIIVFHLHEETKPGQCSTVRRN